MRIGIVSLYGWLKLWDNYGTLLQNFALQRFLQNHGHTTFWIRTRPTLPSSSTSKRIVSGVLSLLRHLARALLTPLRGVPQSRRLREYNLRNPRHFDAFMTAFVPVTSHEYSIEELKSAPPEAEALIVGSDQVWRDVTPLNFLEFGDEGARRVAYSVSAPWPSLDERWRAAAALHLHRFDAVSVREAEGVTLLSELGRADAQHTVDPVLLLDAQDYLSVVQATERDQPIRETTLGYFVNMNRLDDIPWAAIVDMSLCRRTPLAVVPLQGSELVVPGHYQFAPTPAEWINAFNRADCVVTNSYHGALFAIIFRKPFLVFLQNGSTAAENCRFSSALGPLGLSKRVLARVDWKGGSGLSINELMNRPIDWPSVESQLAKLRERSALFLLGALEGKETRGRHES